MAKQRLATTWRVKYFILSTHLFFGLNNDTFLSYYIYRLSNEKPSAIFRIGGNGKNSNNLMMTDQVQPQTATLGISIEPIATVEQQLSTLSSTGLVKSSPLGSQSSLVSISQVGQMASRVIENLYNYVTSFGVQDLPMDAITLGQITERGYLPLPAFQKWYDNLSRKLANDPNYLSSVKSA